MKILLRNHKTEKWQIVQSAPYGAESKLQEILAEEPSLISIDEVREGAGSLVTAIREFPLETGYIDILGFTADGNIAIVECKLATNTEIKRKVIGQVLDYGATLWGMDYESLDGKIKERTEKNLADLVRAGVDDPEWDEELFRQNVETALTEGNFILIIVVDEIHEDLSRIIRFVNGAGRPAFALAALEMQRYQHEQTEMLVPHVFGMVPKATAIERSNHRKWDEEQFFEEIALQHSNCVEPARKILEWAKNNRKISRMYWGEGGSSGSFVPINETNGIIHKLFAVYTYGKIEIYFQFYREKPPFNSVEKRKQLLDKLNHIEGVRIPQDAIERRPNIPLEVFNRAGAMTELIEVLDWVLDEITN
jgi:hypothetical protein